MNGDGLPVFDTFTLAELMRLTGDELDQIDALEDEDEGSRLWWHIKRQEWADEEDGADGRQG
jgi:hypothetical protein